MLAGWDESALALLNASANTRDLVPDRDQLLVPANEIDALAGALANLAPLAAGLSDPDY